MSKKADSTVVYECRNTACTLGTRKDYGRFTGGMEQQAAINITADPDAIYGDGICPNCGEPGTAAEED